MSHIGIATQREVEIVEAMKRLSVADASTLSIFWIDEWGGYTRNNLVANTGTCVPDTTRPSCILTSTGVTGSSIGGHYGTVMATTTSAWLPPGTGGEWYVSSRFQVTTAIDNNTTLSTLAGNAGSGDYMLLGVCGTVVNAGGSNTVYIGFCTANGSPIKSTVAIDGGTNTWHIARMWRKSGVTSLSIDAETPVTGNTYTTTGLVGVGGTSAANNGTAANRAIVTDWQFATFARSTT